LIARAVVSPPPTMTSSNFCISRTLVSLGRRVLRRKKSAFDVTNGT